MPNIKNIPKDKYSHSDFQRLVLRDGESATLAFLEDGSEDEHIFVFKQHYNHSENKITNYALGTDMPNVSTRWAMWAYVYSKWTADDKEIVLERPLILIMPFGQSRECIAQLEEIYDDVGALNTNVIRVRRRGAGLATKYLIRDTHEEVDWAESRYRREDPLRTFEEVLHIE